MQSTGGSGTGLPRVSRLMGATAMAFVLALAAIQAGPALSQNGLFSQQASANSQLLLESDTLIYDNDRNTVTAAGDVKIDYDGNRLVADRVIYDRGSGRLIARGNVQIVDRDGNKIFSDHIDVTDDFGDGFVNALQVETPDKTYFGAESAERRGGTVTTFNNGVYTACEPCEDNPGKAPIWRVKARKIIWNSEEKTIRFERARFELFGLPIIQLPYFKIADHTVKRKSGFLIPGLSYGSAKGAGITVPYYLALSPTYDMLLAPRYYSNQGFLGHAEFRQQFDSGQYNLQIAGIRQQNPQDFDLNTVDAAERDRFMFATKGDFKINPRWSFGWDVLVQTDKNFSRSYGIGEYGDYVERSEIYLTGLNDKNYFDLRAYKFHVQEITLNPLAARHELQPYVLPSFDYTNTLDTPILGGQLTFEMNAQGLDRDRIDSSLGIPTVRGIDGQTARVTAEVEWKRQMIAPGGLVVTPLLHARADGIHFDPMGSTVADINAMALALGVAADVRSSYYRSMATAGLELRYPILFSTTSSSHVLEPMAQIFVRPNESYGSTLGIPNEDAQSFVFDATTLFERDKFSGYDRMEGGSRVNLGIRYSGSFANGWSANGIFGQSYHFGGMNPFASPDLVNVGAFSGLESDTSDFVGLVGLASPGGLSMSASGRFDEKTFEMRRGELKAGINGDPLSLSARYAYIQAQPLYGFTADRQELTLAASAKVNENWSAFGSGTYDFVSDQIVRNSFGFSYDDECFTYAMTYSEIRPTNPALKTYKSVGFNLSFRTLGDFGSDTGTID